MRRKLSAKTLTIGAVVLVAAFSAAQKDEAQAACVAAADAAVQISVIPWEIAYDYTRTQAQLTPMVNRRGWLHEGHLVRGVYNAELMHRFELSFEQAGNAPSGEACLRVSGVTLDLSYHEPTIYLARELMWAACVANQVRAHEQKHAARDEEVIAWFKTYMEPRLGLWVLNEGAVATGDPGQGAETLETRFRQMLREEVATFTDYRNEQQLAIDTPGEYARIDAACPNN